jgi:hypothetical protein
MLIVEEKSDIIFYTNNSFYLEQHLPNAQLILYPDAAHGFLFSNRRCSSNTRALSARLTPTVDRSGVSLDAKSPRHSSSFVQAQHFRVAPEARAVGQQSQLLVC